MGSKKKPNSPTRAQKKYARESSKRSTKMVEKSEIQPKRLKDMDWVLAGKLHKARDFRATAKISPADTLMDAINRLTSWDSSLPDSDPNKANIVDFAVSKNTNKHFEEKLKMHAGKKYPWMRKEKIASSVSFTLLNAEPYTLESEGVEDFRLYVSLDAIKAGRVTLK